MSSASDASRARAARPAGRSRPTSCQRRGRGDRRRRAGPAPRDRHRCPRRAGSRRRPPAPRTRAGAGRPTWARRARPGGRCTRLEGRQQGALRADGPGRRLVWRAAAAARTSASSWRHSSGDRTLSGRGHEHLRSSTCVTSPVRRAARGRPWQDHGVVVPLAQPADARVDVATEIVHVQVRTHRFHLRGTAQAGGAHAGAAGRDSSRLPEFESSASRGSARSR